MRERFGSFFLVTKKSFCLLDISEERVDRHELGFIIREELLGCTKLTRWIENQSQKGDIIDAMKDRPVHNQKSFGVDLVYCEAFASHSNQVKYALKENAPREQCNPIRFLIFPKSGRLKSQSSRSPSLPLSDNHHSEVKG